MVPKKNPRRVERNVKAMSMPALPLVKKISSVSKIVLGYDQKKASMKPRSALTSQRAMIAMRMPICVPAMAQVGQACSVGNRRVTGRDALVVVAMRSAPATRAPI